MSQTLFSSSAEIPEQGAKQTGSQNTVCPFANLPPQFWANLHRQPFRKRHPIIFWLLAILLVALLLNNLFAFFRDEDPQDEDRIALVKIEGAILDSTSTIDWINKILERPDARGILVRINSPGGGAAASQEIYYALKRATAKMPVCVSMGATAASGGLMASMAGQRIFASPSTITGSIGVRMDIPQLQGLMEKLGIGQETLVTGPFKDAASYTHPLTPADREYLQGVIDNMHSQFVKIVAEARKMPLEKATALATGKIYTGQQALELGLIDELGSQSDAQEWLANKLGLPAERALIEKPARKRKLIEMILQNVKNECVNLFTEMLGEANPIFSYR